MQLKGLTFLSLSSSSLMESFWSSAIRSLVAMNLKSLSLDVIFEKIIINEKMKSSDKCSHLLLQLYSSIIEPPLKFVHVTTFPST